MDSSHILELSLLKRDYGDSSKSLMSNGVSVKTFTSYWEWQ